MEYEFSMLDTGQRIRYLRESRNLSQTQLAEKVGVKPSSISSYEVGKTNPSAEVLKDLAFYLDTTTDILLCMDKRYLLAYDPSDLTEAQFQAVKAVADSFVEQLKIMKEELGKNEYQ